MSGAELGKEHHQSFLNPGQNYMILLLTCVPYVVEQHIGARHEEQPVQRNKNQTKDIESEGSTNKNNTNNLQKTEDRKHRCDLNDHLLYHHHHQSWLLVSPARGSGKWCTHSRRRASTATGTPV